MYTRRTLFNFNESPFEHILFGGCGLPPPVLDWIISYYKAFQTNLHIHSDFKVGQMIKAAFKSIFFQMCRFKMSFSLNSCEKVVLLRLWMYLPTLSSGWGLNTPLNDAIIVKQAF